MTAPIPTSEPGNLIAGDTAKWVRALPDYPADEGWLLTYTLVSAAQRYTFGATALGADHLVTVAAATTAAYVPGDYTWRAQASKAGEVYTVGSGRVVVQASFGAATDARSQARRTLDAIEATLEGRATSATESYAIAGREMRFFKPAELLMLRDKYRAEVAREDAAARVASGMRDPRRVFVRFGP